MHLKTSQRYISIDDKDCDSIYYECVQTDEQVFKESNDLLPQTKVKKTYSSLFASVFSILLGFCLLSIVTIVCNKYAFGINISNTLWNEFSVNDKNLINDLMPLSAFEKAVTVETECNKMIGLVEENAFAFKVSLIFILITFYLN